MRTSCWDVDENVLMAGLSKFLKTTLQKEGNDNVDATLLFLENSEIRTPSVLMRTMRRLDDAFLKKIGTIGTSIRTS